MQDGQLLPNNLSTPLCVDWMFVGRKCGHPYGLCESMHFRFDNIRDASDKKKVADHVAQTNGLWFNKSDVKSLTDALHKAKLGDANGCGTD